MKLIIGTANFAKLYGLDKKKIKKKKLKIIFDYLKKKTFIFLIAQMTIKICPLSVDIFLTRQNYFIKLK